MELFPAIDIKNRRVVRLAQGDYDRVSAYAAAPAEMAAAFAAQGAKNLHVVDLDGAKDGALPNFGVIKELLTDGRLFTQIGGGIRDERAVEAYLSLGAGRVILGTAAVENFPFVKEMTRKYGARIAVGVDARDGLVKTRGWLADSGLDSFEFCKRLEQAGVSTIIYTDISRDGLMQGTNLDAYRRLCETVSCNIVASGGVSTREDIAALAAMKLCGVIVGKALYEGALTVAELLALFE